MESKYTGEVLLRLPEVLEVTGLSRTQLYGLVDRRDFPRPIKLSGRTIAWPGSAVDGWVRGRIREADNATA